MQTSVMQCNAEQCKTNFGSPNPRCYLFFNVLIKKCVYLFVNKNNQDQCKAMQWDAEQILELPTLHVSYFSMYL